MRSAEVVQAPAELVRVENLRISFPAGVDGRGRNVVVDDISFSINKDEILGLVGESGSGKTVTALSILRLLRPPGRIDGGRIWLGDQDLVEISEAAMRRIRGSRISMVFQSPTAALNPIMRVGDQVARVYVEHFNLSRREAMGRAVEMLRTVQLPDAEKVAASYPHQLSGGMCQRVVIAAMVACGPDLLIADEPTTALDVTIQAQIFRLLASLQRDLKTAILLITHDLGIIAENCTRVAVMHSGRIVEVGDVLTVFERHEHPYTKELLRSVLRIDRDVALPESPDLGAEEACLGSLGCRFAFRCPEVMPICTQQRPEAIEVAEGHHVMCHRHSGSRS